MTSPVLSVEKCLSANLPPGEYEGVWSGYLVEINSIAGPETWRLKTAQGIRGSCTCRIIAELDGTINVESTGPNFSKP